MIVHPVTMNFRVPHERNEGFGYLGTVLLVLLSKSMVMMNIYTKYSTICANWVLGELCCI